MGRLIEGLWDCKYCGTKRNRGSIRECPNCGRPRDEDTTFYMPDAINYVSEETAEAVNKNPDWVCPYCNSLNSDSETTCESCGAARTSENLDYFSIKEKKHSKDSATDTIKKTSIEDYGDSEYGYTHSKQNNITQGIAKISNFIKNNWKFFVIIPLILAFVVGMVFLFIPKNEEITIKEFSWERSIEIERYKTVEESGWSLPAGARLQYTNLEFSHYQSVFDHYETKTRQVAKERLVGYEDYVAGYRDLGNGYFEEIISQRPVYETYYETETYQEAIYRDEPVYLTKYYYEIDKWLYERSIPTKGLNKEPYWGEATLGEDERISNRIEKYYITGINSKEEKQTISLDYEVWLNLNVEQTVKLKVSILGHGELVE